MLKITVLNQAELATVIHREAGVQQSLADQFAALASCGQVVEFTVETRVTIPQLATIPQLGAVTLVMQQDKVTWQAEAGGTWELRKVES